MFAPQGPTVRELAVQALSSVEHGYDLLAPKFDLTPFRTPEVILASVAGVLDGLGPFGRGLDLCCGTGAGLDVLGKVCRDGVTGVDISAGMLAVAARAHPEAALLRADVRALPLSDGFDLAVSFGAFGHFLPEERPSLFAQTYAALRPGGRFAFPVMAPFRPGTPGHLALLGFDTAMRVRNALWRPPFVMYYRGFRLSDVRQELAAVGFGVELYALEELGRRRDGSPRARLVVATK